MFFFKSEVELEVLPSAISRPMERASELTGLSVLTLQKSTKNVYQYHNKHVYKL